ncbi:ATP-dependent helicase HrpB [Frateuria aurantia]|uniref:ATP-dependent helicase HrpB n=1 Tax=Frateuria aurantia (strain ATCC 33424 / DSM 6220 / KCTC 2777 / LMG 1558 / NBRC 3245 / NCIMB 13370) TaxID=767434 RepID=H8L0J3_FRAAD|nr:ATP-dependent helicase HrpB [Frateuria aurantia]AFC84619.1 ATP-dependent helicase HrpB [Frateuria aurantia DSM 6220]
MSSTKPVEFPIAPVLPEIRRSLAAQPRLVLEAPPGAGKTTQVPLALLSEPWLEGRRIIMLEPRRVAVRLAAQFMAAQLGESVGQTVGYRIRFESRISAATRIEVVTEGILARMIQDDPELEGIGAILFDEFHERHLAADLGLALALDVQATLRPDLRLVLMSATLDGERIAVWLKAPRLSSAGRSFPVAIHYPPARPQETPDSQLVRGVQQALAETDGDVLVFLPGRAEIARLQRRLEQVVAAGVEVLPLHGELTLADQQQALQPAADGERRVVLATNVAESSLTLPGVRAVVDQGLAREPRFDPASGFTRLATVAISQASADQRAGRAGRVAAGHAYRLWPQSRRLEPARSPEIAQVELSTLALELAAWGSSQLSWLDTPPAGAMAQARDLLGQLGALDAAGRITAQGRRMLALGAPPRLAAAVLQAPERQQALVADVLALMESRSPLRGEAARTDDFRPRLAALHGWRDRRSGRGGLADADIPALAAIEQLSKGWRQRLGCRAAASGVPDAWRTGGLLLAAYPDRIAHQDPQQPLRYTLSNGRGCRLHESTSLLGEPWLVVMDLRHESRDSLVMSAAPLDPADLERVHAGLFNTARRVVWNVERQAAEAFEESRFGAIVLERRSVPVEAGDALAALLAAIRQQGLGCLPWTEASERLRARNQALRSWQPALDLPDLSEEHLLATLEDWLAPWLQGKRRLDALSGGELARALEGWWDYPARQQLEAQAPEAITVPSGQSRRLDYAAEGGPVLAVKLQELFGLADTPTIAGGTVPVVLHLLSPAGRPIQVTRDLRSFWERTYPEVKKELKGRYPRHPWPDDPWTATATHRAKPRPR